MPFSVVGLPDICGVIKKFAVSNSAPPPPPYRPGFHCQDVLDMFHWRVMPMAGEGLIFYGVVVVAL
jgi:hypothetical protein